MTEYRQDGHIVLGWLKEANFKHWSTASQSVAFSSASPFFITVPCSDNRFEAWIAAKLETSLKDLTASVSYYIKLN
jgi:hypothetical protein